LYCPKLVAQAAIRLVHWLEISYFSLPCSNMTLKLVFLPVLFAFMLADAHLNGGAENLVVNVDAASSSLPSQTAAITLKAQQPDFSSFDLTGELTTVPYTTASLDTVPPSCESYTAASASSTLECPAGNTMSDTSVTFADCGSTFTICRCDNSTTMSLGDALNTFAQVPVGLRRFVGNVVLMPDSVPHAYTLTSGDIHMFATTALDTWIHESTHALDYAIPDTPLSNTTEWLSTQLTDSCVPDVYSQTNAIEDFAQVSVLKIYALAHNGQLPPLFDNQCMRNQLAFMDSLPQYNASAMFGNTCDIQTTGDISGIESGSGAKHLTPPATIDSKLMSPFKTTNTTAASGFRKVPAPTAAVIAAGSKPSTSSATALSVAWSVCTVALTALVALTMIS